MEKEIEVYREKLKRYYNEEGKLASYPSKQPMRVLALIGIAEKFEAKRKYTEKEVNEIIKASIAFGDVELVRREVFQYKFIGRLRDGSEYWAEPEWRVAYEQFL